MAATVSEKNSMNLLDNRDFIIAILSKIEAHYRKFQTVFIAKYNFLHIYVLIDTTDEGFICLVLVLLTIQII